MFFACESLRIVSTESLNVNVIKAIVMLFVCCVIPLAIKVIICSSCMDL